MRSSTLFVIDHLDSGVILDPEAVRRSVVLSVSCPRDTAGSVVLDKDNDVLPLVAVAAAAGPEVLFEVVLVHDGAPAVVAPHPGVDVVVLEPVELAAVVVRAAACAEAGVEVGGTVDGRGVVAAVFVEVDNGLEAVLHGVGANGDGAANAAGDENGAVGGNVVVIVELADQHRRGKGVGEGCEGAAQEGEGGQELHV